MVNGEKSLVKSPFTLSKSSDGVVFAASDLASSATFATIWTYSVPLGTAFQITPVNYIFGFYFDTAGATDGNIISAGQTRLLKSNANGSDTREVWAGANGIFKDIGDERQRPKLRVPVVANASQKVIVQVKDLGTTLDVSTSDFFIEGVQFYEQV